MLADDARDFRLHRKPLHFHDTRRTKNSHVTHIWPSAQDF